MLKRVIDDFKESSGSVLRLTSLAAAIGLALFVMASFLCAAAFVFVLQRNGPVDACLTGAGIFLIVSMIAAACYGLYKRQTEFRAAERAKSVVPAALADPVLIATGIQVIRAIGVKKLIPILAVAGLALGLLATRSASGHQTPAE
jgi:hypothetical protein